MVRQNFDKRTLRKMYAASFCVGIDAHLAASNLDAAGGDGAAPAGTTRQKALQVLVRKRPLFEHEEDAGEFDVVRTTPRGALVFGCCMRPSLKRPYLAPHLAPLECFGEGACTDEVCARLELDEMVRICLSGGTAAVCMFGQTGSGKTHTMQGVLSRAAALLFGGAGPCGAAAGGSGRGGGAAGSGAGADASGRREDQKRGGGGAAAVGPGPGAGAVWLSCYEVCGQACYDLLESRAPARALEGADGSTRVTASCHAVGGADEFWRLIDEARAARKSAPTARNGDSSRSHAFYHLSVTGGRGGSAPCGAEYGAAPETSACGALLLVDLAGAERAGDSAAHGAAAMAQAAEINGALSTLKECFRLRSATLRAAAAGEGGAEGGAAAPPAARGAPAPHVPYRRSLLTRLLRAALEADGRGGRMALVATVSPCASDTEATLNTLRHACVMAGLCVETDADMKVCERDIPVVAPPLPIDALCGPRAAAPRAPSAARAGPSAAAPPGGPRRLAADAMAAARRAAAAGRGPGGAARPSAVAAAAGVSCGEPLKWSAADVAAWMRAVCKGAYASAAALLATGADGRALSRMPAARFKQLCGGDGARGHALYELFRQELRSASDQKAKAALAAAELLRTRRTLQG